MTQPYQIMEAPKPSFMLRGAEIRQRQNLLRAAIRTWFPPMLLPSIDIEECARRLVFQDQQPLRSLAIVPARGLLANKRFMVQIRLPNGCGLTLGLGCWTMDPTTLQRAWLWERLPRTEGVLLIRGLGWLKLAMLFGWDPNVIAPFIEQID